MTTTVPFIPRLDTFTLSGAAYLNIGQPLSATLLISNPVQTIQMPNPVVTVAQSPVIALRAVA
jgi:hypothetical protein